MRRIGLAVVLALGLLASLAVGTQLPGDPPAILIVPVSAQDPKVLPRILTDPTLLASRTWKSDTGLEKAVSDWPLYEGKPEFDDKTVVVRRGQVQVAGVVLEADYRIHVAPPLVETCP